MEGHVQFNSPDKTCVCTNLASLAPTWSAENGTGNVAAGHACWSALWVSNSTLLLVLAKSDLAEAGLACSFEIQAGPPDCSCEDMLLPDPHLAANAFTSG